MLYKRKQIHFNIASSVLIQLYIENGWEGCKKTKQNKKSILLTVIPIIPIIPIFVHSPLFFKD